MLPGYDVYHLGVQPDRDKPNHHTVSRIASALDSTPDCEQDPYHCTRTELDSHANMPVVGNHVLVLNHHDKQVDVSPFSPDYSSLTVEVVDAAIKYDCNYTGETYIFIICNALLVPSMGNNLIPPFMMREAGLVVNETPKIQVDDPSITDHSIYFPTCKL